MNFDVEQFSKVALDAAKLMNPSERQMLREFLQRAKNIQDFKHIKEWMQNPDKWLMPMVSMDTFLDDPHYLGIGQNVYPKVRQICREIVEGNYREGCEVAGIGSGKSYSSEVLACYFAHKLLCLRDACRNYNLTPDKPITILNMGTTASQALDNVFTGIKSFVKMSPFFMQFQPKILEGSVSFELQKVLLWSGNSKATTPLGYNVFFATLDEAAFYLDNQNKSVAQEIYESMQRRIVSRFGNEGLIMMISSPRYNEDFIMKKLAEARALNPDGTLKNPHIYSVNLPIWKFKGVGYYPKDKYFYFNQRTCEILEGDEKVIRAQHKVNDIDDPDFDESYDVWQVPEEYKATFRGNPERAKRDYGAVPSLTLEGFFPNPLLLRQVYNWGRKNPVKGPGKYEFEERPLRVPYYIHIDIGMNRDGVGDFTGFCMGHFDKWVLDEETGEQRMRIYIDLVERIGMDQRFGQVDLAKVRQRIYDLKAMGFNIKLVTLDQYQSTDFMQTLNKKGFQTELLSTVRTIDPYNALKEAFYENRIDIPYVEELDSELARLELIKGVEVDHPPNGSKDLADAVAGVVFNIITHTPSGSLNMAVPVSQGSPNIAGQQHALKKKEEHYRRIEAAVKRRDDIENRLRQMGR